MTNDDVTAVLGALALFIAFPAGLVLAITGRFDMAAVALALAAYLQALANHKA